MLYLSNSESEDLHRVQLYALEWQDAVAEPDVLIVHDDRQIRDFFRDVLQDAGYDGIARRVPLTYATIKQRFTSYADVDVVLDRRHGQRRRLVLPTDADRRFQDRRSLKVDALLRQLGWVVVERGADEAKPDSS